MSDLPPLPKHSHSEWPDLDDTGHGYPLFTADQMREYALAAVAAEREACARIADDFDAYDDESTGTGVSSGIAAAIRAR